MDKMRMESLDMTAQNIEKIGALFPNCITETVDENGKAKKAINFELLKQMLSGDVIEGSEAYEFTWVGKKAAIVEANRPIRKTLRPCKEDSVNWDTTENLYIEGDNLEVLKLLQESYLGAVKMIYIDPPYNTGNDFIYRDDYKQSESNSQKIRVMSESWVAHNVFCPICGSPHISKLNNNMPVADLSCSYCGEIFELKSKCGNIGNKISDGAYSTMIDRITSSDNPDLFVMQYSADFQVVNLTLIPKFFFTPSIIEKRKPLSANAKRAGWIGCNILYSDIPKQGKIAIINRQKLSDVKTVTEEYSKIKKLQINNIENRGWLLDVLTCINAIDSVEFSLQDVYTFVEVLQKKHITNNNIEAKIRQQLQILRNKGIIEFLGRGHYRKKI